jgi:hypothetical protein
LEGTYNTVPDGTITGTLTFDATTGKFTSVDIYFSSAGEFTLIGENLGFVGIVPYQLSLSVPAAFYSYVLLPLDSTESLLAGLPTTINYDAYGEILNYDANGQYDVINIDGLKGVMAVPETSTWAMLLIGFAGIGFASYRKSRRPSFT